MPSPQEHYDEAERLAHLAQAVDFGGDNWVSVSRHFTELAQVHATLALAGFTRDATTGADHVHPVGSKDTAIMGTVVDPFTGPGRPA